MPLYTTQGIFVYRGTEVDKQHIVQCATTPNQQICNVIQTNATNAGMHAV